VEGWSKIDYWASERRIQSKPPPLYSYVFYLRGRRRRRPEGEKNRGAYEVCCPGSEGAEAVEKSSDGWFQFSPLLPMRKTTKDNSS
jgi:hypothetical protein